MSNVFRKTYRELGDAEKAQIEALKTKAEELYEMMPVTRDAPGAREMALARTNLEQSVMWAVKAITG